MTLDEFREQRENKEYGFYSPKHQRDSFIQLLLIVGLIPIKIAALYAIILHSYLWLGGVVAYICILLWWGVRCDTKEEEWDSFFEDYVYPGYKANEIEYPSIDKL